MSFRLGPYGINLCHFFRVSVVVGSFPNVYSFMLDLPLDPPFNLYLIATCRCIIVLLCRKDRVVVPNNQVDDKELQFNPVFLSKRLTE